MCDFDNIFNGIAEQISTTDSLNDDLMIMDRWYNITKENCKEDLSLEELLEIVELVPEENKDLAKYLIRFICSFKETRVDKVVSKRDERTLLVLPNVHIALDIFHNDIEGFLGGKPTSDFYPNYIIKVMGVVQNTCNYEPNLIFFTLNDAVQSSNNRPYISIELMEQLMYKAIDSGDLILRGKNNVINKQWEDILNELLRGGRNRNWVCDKTYISMKTKLDNRKIPFQAICYENVSDIIEDGNILKEVTAIGEDISNYSEETNIAIFTKAHCVGASDSLKFHGIYRFDKKNSITAGYCCFKKQSNTFIWSELVPEQ